MRKFKGQLPPFLHAVDDKTIDHPIMGIYIPNGGKKGEITFGGINEVRLKKATAVSANIKAGGTILIQMKKLMLGEIEGCKEEDGTCEALIDTGCSDIYGPKAKVNKFREDILSKLTNNFVESFGYLNIYLNTHMVGMNQR